MPLLVFVSVKRVHREVHVCRHIRQLNKSLAQNLYRIFIRTFVFYNGERFNTFNTFSHISTRKNSIKKEDSKFHIIH